MAPKTLPAGVTGTNLTIHDTYPEYDYALYVRNKERAKVIADKYTDVKFVYGNLESTDVIEKVASEVNVVVHTTESVDSGPAARAIAKGLAAGHSAKNPGYYIHLSGAGILTYIVQNINSDAVRFLIVAPPVIYGIGKDLVNKSRITVPTLTKATFDLGYAPFVGAGKAKWDNVHVEDLADLLIKCVEASQDSTKDNHEIWSKQAYCFVTGDEHQWKDLAAWVAEEVHR
ncbi:hypothetical protein ACHAPI_000467 [Fusarium lateritium]